MTQPTILTVDDSRTMRDMLRLALADAGYRVVQAVDGLHGLEVLSSEQPNVIITDINMPRLRRLRIHRAGPDRFAVPRRSDPGSDHRKLGGQEEPGATRRRHGLDRQAIRFDEARRRRAARGCLNSSGE